MWQCELTLRALFQHKKGRDLFDLWLAVEYAGVQPAEIAACLQPYRPDGWTVERAIENPITKLADDPVLGPELV